MGILHNDGSRDESFVYIGRYYSIVCTVNFAKVSLGFFSRGF